MSKYQQNVSRFNNLDCFGLIGDSHASAGTALQSEYTGTWPTKYAGVSAKGKILYKDDRTSESATLRWVDYDESQNRFPGYEAIGNTITSVGFDNSLMWYLKENRKKNVGLVKWALGGTSLLAFTGANNDWGLSTGEMWTSFSQYYGPKGVGKAIDIGYYNPTMKAIVICLGTNDCISGVWNNTNFIAAIPLFVAAIRAAFGQPSLPVYWLQVRSDLYLSGLADYPEANVNACRAAIANCASGGGTEISNFFVLDYESETDTVDTVHYDADSNEYIGLQLGATLNAL